MPAYLLKVRTALAGCQRQALLAPEEKQTRMAAQEALLAESLWPPARRLAGCVALSGLRHASLDNQTVAAEASDALVVFVLASGYLRRVQAR
jgi:hypothetical protein